MVRYRLGFGNPIPFGVSFGDVETVHLVFGGAFLSQHRFFAAVDNKVASCVVRALARNVAAQVRVLRQHANAGLQHDWKLSNVNAWERGVHGVQVVQVFTGANDVLHTHVDRHGGSVREVSEPGFLWKHDLG